MAEPSLAELVQAVLFVASEPLSAGRLAEATATSEQAVTEALTHTRQALVTTGLRLEQLDGRYRLVTAPATTPAVRRFLQDEARSELSRPALETLAIVAYRGPITRAGIEAIRGVSSETMLRNLATRGLIAEAGHSPEPGKPVLYRVSQAFLQHFGLTSPEDLPPVAEPEAAEPEA